MVWNGKSKILVGGEVVYETDDLITAEDVLRVKAERNLGTIDVIDVSSGRSLLPEDFPRGGTIKLVPVYKAGNL